MVAEMFYLFADWQISLGVLSKFEGSGSDLAPLGPKDNHVVGREADWIQRIGPVLHNVKRLNNKRIKNTKIINYQWKHKLAQREYIGTQLSIQ